MWHAIYFHFKSAEISGVKLVVFSFEGELDLRQLTIAIFPNEHKPVRSRLVPDRYTSD